MTTETVPPSQDKVPSSSSKTRQATTKDVAALAGVNPASVSVVLNGARSSAGVSEETRGRIMAAAEQLGYRRNGMAAATRTGRFGSVGLLQAVDPNASGLPPSVLEGIHRELELRRTHLIMHRLPLATLSNPVQLPKVLTEWSCDGLLVDMTYRIPPLMEQAIEKSKLPAVWGNVLRECDAVRPDDYEAGRQAARHILKLGHRRICYLDLGHSWSEVQQGSVGTTAHYSAHHRYAGVRDEVQSAGAEFIVKVQDDNLDIRERQKFERLFEKNCRHIRHVIEEQKPTAIISYDAVGFSTLVVTRDLGLKVPDDLSLLCFGPADSWFMGHELTSMTTPEQEMGQRMVQQLFEKIEQPTLKRPHCVIPFGFYPGKTCAPPR